MAETEQLLRQDMDFQSPQRTEPKDVHAPSTVKAHIIKCNKLINIAIKKNWSLADLANTLKGLGITAAKAINYIEEFKQKVCIGRQQKKGRAEIVLEKGLLINQRRPLLSQVQELSMKRQFMRQIGQDIEQ
ncbi:hypothetical protein H0H87_008180, partial [Tephrocybe sp. NHM501043]